MERRTDRRGFLIGAGLAAGLGLSARAQWSGRGASEPADDPDVFVFSRLRFHTLHPTQDQWNCGIDKEEDFLAYLRESTNLKLTDKDFYARSVGIEDLRQVYFHPEQESLVYTHPFLFMTCSGEFRFEKAEAATLAEFLKRGGFMYVDDCITDGESIFYGEFLREIRTVFPDQEMEPVPYDHEIYHCFYDFAEGTPWVQGERVPDMGLTIDGRLAVFLTGVDLHCGWRWEHTGRTPYPDKYMCRKMGVNIVIYALTH